MVVGWLRALRPGVESFSGIDCRPVATETKLTGRHLCINQLMALIKSGKGSRLFSCSSSGWFWPEYFNFHYRLHLLQLSPSRIIIWLIVGWLTIEISTYQ
jgi:hypothetical protein